MVVTVACVWWCCTTEHYLVNSQRRVEVLETTKGCSAARGHKPHESLVLFVSEGIQHLQDKHLGSSCEGYQHLQETYSDWNHNLHVSLVAVVSEACQYLQETHGGWCYKP